MLPVPTGSARSAAERSKRVIIRARAMMLPSRPGSCPPPMAEASPSTAAVMSTLRPSIASASITSCACSRLSGLEVRYGIRTPITLSAPSASAARKATTELSTPPESPTTTFSKPRRRRTSSRRNSTSHRRVSSGSISRGEA